MKNRLFLLILLTLSFIISSCSNGNAETGILTGTVTIGPISPVVRPGEEPVIPCEVYETRKIMVYDGDMEELIKQVGINCDGIYMVELTPGVYAIDINSIGIDYSDEVPRKIVIRPGDTYELNLDIDTGIR
jgi:hypothetical protein